MKAMHLVGRFLGSLWPLGPRAADRDWAFMSLLDSEQELWWLMSNADRRHTIAVAREVDRLLDGQAPREVLAAALLHDIGKIESRLGTPLRVVATLSAAIAGHEMADAWAGTTGVTRRIGLYLLHPEVGGDLLAMAGSDPLTVAWAREHHMPAEEWTVDSTFANALDAADND